ncbi:hypothetical protein LTR56_025958 [Elasticomyces elasticus]|nr:hypothetical protein LTR56_025958 [Elasticomyces elasticus]KAK3621096.1 hypothetical protein LTR22_025332 [Elasticomyces elasticus]KAK4913988.1 hypothetical protein LTR49_017702 [Elasticomyces elasticus]KAK5739356.1 hypothetical protein LTS12_025292 [Elasticomyces elasticus]
MRKRQALVTLHSSLVFEMHVDIIQHEIARPELGTNPRAIEEWSLRELATRTGAAEHRTLLCIHSDPTLEEQANGAPSNGNDLDLASHLQRISPGPAINRPSRLRSAISPAMAWSVEAHRVSTDISWTDFAYCTYAIDTESLCNSVMLLESLHRLGVNADRMLLHSDLWNASDTTFEREARLLRRARDDFGAKLQAIEVLREDNVADPTWASGFTKLLAFNQTQYKRVLSLDADATILRSMDEIFLMPPAPVANKRINGCNPWVRATCLETAEWRQAAAIHYSLLSSIGSVGRDVAQPFHDCLRHR